MLSPTIHSITDFFYALDELKLVNRKSYVDQGVRVLETLPEVLATKLVAIIKRRGPEAYTTKIFREYIRSVGRCARHGDVKGPAPLKENRPGSNTAD